MKTNDKRFFLCVTTSLIIQLFQVTVSYADSDQKLIQQFGYSAHLCTAEGVPDDKMAKACEEREALWEELYERGYTYGCDGDSDEQRYWRNDCE